MLIAKGGIFDQFIDRRRSVTLMSSYGPISPISDTILSYVEKICLPHFAMARMLCFADHSIGSHWSKIGNPYTPTP